VEEAGDPLCRISPLLRSFVLPGLPPEFWDREEEVVMAEPFSLEKARIWPFLLTGRRLEELLRGNMIISGLFRLSPLPSSRPSSLERERVLMTEVASDERT
jgi:hypothetical protein